MPFLETTASSAVQDYVYKGDKSKVFLCRAAAQRACLVALLSPRKFNIFSREDFAFNKLLPLSLVHMQFPHHFAKRRSTAAFAVRSQRVSAIRCSFRLCTTHALLYSSLTIVQPSITRKLPMMTACSSRSILSIKLPMMTACSSRSILSIKLPMMTACSSRSILSIPMTLPLLCTTLPTPPTAVPPLHA